ncbi:hypothetical protein NCS52_00842400 [Fusarium sp. LHS14.1]|nr:hypothetical protein NCS52_00842400 [Fusarium sp. LHS14.1]
MNAQTITDLNKSLKRKLCGHGNRHVKAWILVWDGTPCFVEDEKRKVFKNYLSATFLIKAETVKIRDLRDQDENLIANLGSCTTVLIMYYVGNGAVSQDGPVWKPTPARKPHHTDTRRTERHQGGGVPQQNDQLLWSDLKAIIAGLNREILLITDYNYWSGITTAMLLSDGPANLDTFQVLTSVPTHSSNFIETLKTALKKPAGGKIGINYIFAGSRWQGIGYINLSRDTAADGIALYRPRCNLNRLALVPFHGDGKTICSYINEHWSKEAPREVTGIQVTPNQHRELEITVSVVDSETNESPAYLRWIRQLYLNTGTFLGNRARDSLGQAIQDPKEVVQEWNSEDGRSWTILPGPHDGHYGRVHVLSLRFERPGFNESDTKRLGEEFTNIREAFDHCFGFDVQSTFLIPPNNGEMKLKDKLESTINGLSSRDLLIAVYSGHGENPKKNDGNAIWTGSKDTDKVNWSSLQGILYGASCDTAQIIDCCYSGSAIPMKHAPQGRNEILAASSRKLVAYIDHGSYLNTICEALRDLAGENLDQPPFSLNKLHNLLLRKTYAYNKDNPKKQQHPDREHWLHEDSPNSITLRPKSTPSAVSGKVFARVKVENLKYPGQIVFQTAEEVLDGFERALAG